MRAVQTLQQFALALSIPGTTTSGLALALEECGSNIVNHALRRDPASTFQVRLERDGERFLIELRDPGPPFDPTAAPARELRAGDDDVPGGWGIQLVRRHVDEIRYAREGRENVLTLIRRLPPPAAGGHPPPNPRSIPRERDHDNP